jgi:hypothetical protein
MRAGLLSNLTPIRAKSQAFPFPSGGKGAAKEDLRIFILIGP